MNGSALLIVDVQNDFCPGGNLSVPDGDKVIPVINSIAGDFKLTVATQDWHPANHISFASSHNRRRPFENIITEGVEQALWPDHCIAGTRGAELHPALNTKAVALILRKGRAPALDSYSAFFENDGNTSTGLGHYLKGMSVSRIFLAGLAYDVCVFRSALDAADLGFETFVIRDACRGIDIPKGNVRAAEKKMTGRGIEIIDSGDLPL